jgi:hypothetical protein
LLAVPDRLPAGVTNLRHHVGALGTGSLWGHSGNRHVNGETSIRTSTDVGRTNVQARHGLEPGALPQTAGLDVPVLFSVGYFGVLDALDLPGLKPGIHNPHRDHVFARVNESRYIELERQVTAVM